MPSAEFKDYYRTLELDPGASADEIRQQYRFLASFYHPDANSGDKAKYATRKIQEINEAYEVLRDPKLRAEYDRNYPGANAERASQEDVAAAAYEAAGQFYELIRGAGFWDGVSGRTTDYRDRAVTQLRKVVSQWPSTGAALMAQADIMMLYLLVGEDIPSTRSAAKKLGQMAPGTEWQNQATLVLGVCYSKSGEPDKALKLLDSLKAKTKDYDLKAEAAITIAQIRAEILLAEQRAQTACEEYDKVFREFEGHPVCAQALYSKARIVDSVSRKPQEAISLYRRLVREFPESAEAQDCQWRIQYLEGASQSSTSSPSVNRPPSREVERAAESVGEAVGCLGGCLGQLVEEVTKTILGCGCIIVIIIIILIFAALSSH